MNAALDRLSLAIAEMRANIDELDGHLAGSEVDSQYDAAMSRIMGSAVERDELPKDKAALQDSFDRASYWIIAIGVVVTVGYLAAKGW